MENRIFGLVMLLLLLGWLYIIFYPVYVEIKNELRKKELEKTNNFKEDANSAVSEGFEEN